MADAGNMICPKCGVFQAKAPECAKCGVVVDKFKPAAAGEAPSTAPVKKSSSGGGRRVPIIVVIVIALVGFGGYKMIGGGAEGELEEAMCDVAVFEMFKQHDPAVYEQLKQILLQSMKNRDSRQTVIAKVQTFSASLMQNYLPHASDVAIDNFAHELLRIMDNARDESPQLCYKLLYAKNYTTPEVRTFLEGEINAEFMDTMAEVVRTAKSEPQSLPNPERSQELLQAAVEPMVEDYSEEDLMLLVKPVHDKWEQATMCDLGRDIYRRILLLTQENASAALRYAMTQ